MENFSLTVKVNADRPDFRVFGVYFFGSDTHNYDSDGNSNPVYSRKWTELYMRSRENKDLWFEIFPNEGEENVLIVQSDNIETVNIIAYFLARETQGIIFDNGKIIPLEYLQKNMGDFQLTQRLLLADNCIWRKSKETNPYPNLDD